jgi:hypothetical protein
MPQEIVSKRRVDSQGFLVSATVAGEPTCDPYQLLTMGCCLRNCHPKKLMDGLHSTNGHVLYNTPNE